LNIPVLLAWSSSYCLGTLIHIASLFFSTQTTCPWNGIHVGWWRKLEESRQSSTSTGKGIPRVLSLSIEDIWTLIGRMAILQQIIAD
jgi:hypothetical protein